MNAQLLLLFVHLAALVVWIGSIAATGFVLDAPLGDGRARGAAALRVYRALATPGFAIAFVAGASLLLGDVHGYLVAHHWMHAKLTFALGIIGVHHVLGARAKRASAGGEIAVGQGTKLALVVVALAVAAVASVVLGRQLL